MAAAGAACIKTRIRRNKKKLQNGVKNRKLICQASCTDCKHNQQKNDQINYEFSI